MRAFGAVLRRRSLAPAAAVVLGLGGLLGMTSAASATVYSYCYGSYGADSSCLAGQNEAHTIIRNHVRAVSAVRTVGAAAITRSTGQPRGSWVYGVSGNGGDGSCHSYNINPMEPLQPWARLVGASATMNPRAAYGGNEQPCVNGDGQARTASTQQNSVPTSTGYASISKTSERVCISIPDPIDGAGIVCGSTAGVEKNGLVGALVDPASGDTLSAVSIPPQGGSVVTTPRDSGAANPAPSNDGIAVTSGRFSSVVIKREDGSTANVLSIPKSIKAPSRTAADYLSTFGN